MSDTTLRWEHRYATRRLSRKCECTGHTIDKGDRYFVGAWAVDGSVDSIIALSLPQEILVKSIGDLSEGWNPSDFLESLKWWLLKHLAEDEAALCLRAAKAYCWPQRRGFSELPPRAKEV